MVGATDEPQPFHTTIEPYRDTIVLAAHGELDMASGRMLEAQLGELLATGFARLVLDLRAASFLDSSGLRAILNTRSAAHRSNVEFALIPGPPVVQRVLEITGVEAALEFVDPKTLR